jgi:hypothetical protein
VRRFSAAFVSDTDPGKFLATAVGSDVPAEVLADMDGPTRNGHFLSGSRMSSCKTANGFSLTLTFAAVPGIRHLVGLTIEGLGGIRKFPTS